MEGTGQREVREDTVTIKQEANHKTIDQYTRSIQDIKKYIKKDEVGAEIEKT